MSFLRRSLQRHLHAQDGFTMFVAMGVLLVTSLLLAAAFTAALSDSHLSRADTTQKQAYYAALAGIQEYEYKLQANPDYWTTCEAPSATLPGEGSNESYKITLLPASTSKGATECSTASPFTTMIESEGTLTNTFRIKSTGTVTTTGYKGSATRSLVATFQVSGFLNYLYYTNYEQGDPQLYGTAKEGCEKKYYQEWSIEAKISGCVTIMFTHGDAVNGPFHTNDSTNINEDPSFGRSGQAPPDVVEMNGGVYSSVGSSAEKSAAKCKGTSATFNTTSKCFTEGATLVAPEKDTSLAQYVEPANQFVGATHLVLNGAAETVTVTYHAENAKKELESATTTKTIPWPKNGLIYVKASENASACAYEYKYNSSDNAEEEKEEKGCGNVYVHGTYTKSLTVAGENDLVIDENLYPTGITLGNAPSGTAVLGLIASHYVRVYHPLTGTNCGGSKNAAGSLSNPWIYAALLATAHSFVVDNYNCGEQLGKLHVYGAIAQNYRGPVGTSGGTGYLKDYKYDGRLAVDEPPYFLSPFKAGWKVIRETAPAPG